MNQKLVRCNDQVEAMKEENKQANYVLWLKLIAIYVTFLILSLLYHIIL